jgi:hypothetical protein
LIRRHLFAIPAAVLLLSGAGCIVTKSSYDMKTAETDTLRSALAELNREKARLAAENAELSKQGVACREKEAALAAQVKQMDQSLKRLGEGLTGSRPADDRRRMTREQFIEDLIESERATERRMRDLAARAEACERDTIARRQGIP